MVQLPSSTPKELCAGFFSVAFAAVTLTKPIVTGVEQDDATMQQSAHNSKSCYTNKPTNDSKE